MGSPSSIIMGGFGNGTFAGSPSLVILGDVVAVSPARPAFTTTASAFSVVGIFLSVFVSMVTVCFRSIGSLNQFWSLKCDFNTPSSPNLVPDKSFITLIESPKEYERLPK